MNASINRRAFVKTGLMAVAGITAFGAGSLPARAAGKGMFISLRYEPTWYQGPPGTRADGPHMDWQDMARLAARLGYGGVDLMLEPTMQLGAAKTRSLLSELKLRPGFFGMPFSPFYGTDESFNKGVAQIEDICKFAADVDCRRAMVVMLPSSDKPKEEFWKITQERASRMSEAMNRHNMHMGIEFLGPQYFRSLMKYPFVWKMSETLQWCKEAGPNWGFILDTWHWHLAGGTTQDIETAGRSRIVYVHISDAKTMPAADVRDNMRQFPGEGSINLTGVLQTLEKIGYDSGISPEPLGRIPAEMSPPEAAKLALESTTAVMKKAGVKII